MDCFFKGANEDLTPSPVDILRCPFLRNINEPTNFSFSSMSSMAFPMPVSYFILLMYIACYVTVRVLSVVIISTLRAVSREFGLGN